MDNPSRLMRSRFLSFAAVWLSVLLPSFAFAAEVWTSPGYSNKSSFAAAKSATCTFPASTTNQSCTETKNNATSYFVLASWRDEYGISRSRQNLWQVVCDSGQQLIDYSKKCEVPVVCPASGTQVAPANTVFEAGNGLTSVVCLAGCEASASVAAKGADGKNYVWGPIVATGKSCQAGQSSAPAGSDPPTKCSVGQCPGTINGISRCMPCSETKEVSTKTSADTSTSAASGAASGPASTSTSGSTSSTSCKNGTCTTTETTTTTAADGTKTDKSTSKTQDQQSFCAENPKSAMCKGLDNAWGGSCSSGFQCEGSAVECAIAQASWKSACATDIDPTDSKVTTGNAAMSAGDRPPDHPGNNPATAAFSANLDQTNPYGGECPADMPLDVMGQSFSIPLSHACGSFQFMGKIVVAFSLFAAAYIVFGGIKG